MHPQVPLFGELPFKLLAGYHRLHFIILVFVRGLTSVFFIFINLLDVRLLLPTTHSIRLHGSFVWRMKALEDNFLFYFYLFSHSQNLIQREQKLLIK